MLPTKFRFIWPSGFIGEDFKKSANQKQELPVVAMFGNGRVADKKIPVRHWVLQVRELFFQLFARPTFFLEIF